MAGDVKAVPEGFHTLTPALIVNDAAAAIEFYKNAFGAEETFRMTAPGSDKIMHAELRIGDSNFMLGEECGDMKMLSPTTLGGSGGGLMIYVEDADASFARAVEAGATATHPPSDMFWGDRYGKVTDPFGHNWSIATHVEDVAPEEMATRMESFFAQEAAKAQQA